MNNDYHIEVFPLKEKYMNSAVDGELIIDTKKGHISIKSGDNYLSKTKELEARVNSLSNLSNDLTNHYLDLEEDITYLIDEYKKLKSKSKTTMNTVEDLNSQLDKVKIILDSYKSKLDSYCESLIEFQYTEIRPYINMIVDNLKKVLKLQSDLNELEFLANDLEEQKNSNYYAISVLQ